MGCESIRNKLDDYDVGTLSESESRQVALHLEQCAACMAVWQQVRALRRQLAALPVPAMPDDLLAGLARSGVHRARRRFTGWAVAATLLVGMTVGWFAARQAGTDALAPMQQVTLKAGAVSTVSLAFQSRTAVDNVQFTLHVPEGFVLQGHPGEHELRWKGQLAEGRNLLRLPFTAVPGAHGVLRATLKSGQRERSFRIELEASPVDQRSERESVVATPVAVAGDFRGAAKAREVAYA